MNKRFSPVDFPSASEIEEKLGKLNNKLTNWASFYQVSRQGNACGKRHRNGNEFRLKPNKATTLLTTGILEMEIERAKMNVSNGHSSPISNLGGIFMRGFRLHECRDLPRLSFPVPRGLRASSPLLAPRRV
jgi:hypothetical protein